VIDHVRGQQHNDAGAFCYADRARLSGGKPIPYRRRGKTEAAQKHCPSQATEPVAVLGKLGAACPTRSLPAWSAASFQSTEYFRRTCEHVYSKTQYEDESCPNLPAVHNRPPGRPLLLIPHALSRSTPIRRERSWFAVLRL
jgi:hypothetical protein